MTLRSEAVTSLMPGSWANTGAAPAIKAATKADVSNDERTDICTPLSPSGRRGQSVDAGRKPVLAQGSSDALVVDRCVRVDPVALRIHTQCEDLGQVGPLEQD